MGYEEMKALQEKYEKEILSSGGIHGIGIGRRKNGGDGGGELAFLIYAESQSAVDTLRGKNLLSDIPAPCEYIVEPPFKTDILYVDGDNLVSQDQGRYRPLMGGIQIYLRNGSSSWMGTLGTFVKSQAAGDNNLYMLSNLHVLETVGLAVSQPLSGRENIVGMVSKATDFIDTDAALAIVNAPDDVAVNVIEEIGRVSQTTALTSADLGQRMIKRGRTTGLTEGTLETINGTFKVDGVYRYDCACVRADAGTLFSDRGDSGSPVILKGNGRLAGLHFAGNQKLGGTSIFCKIDNVFRNLNVKLADT